MSYTNIHESDRGRRVIALPDAHRKAFLPTFPGWGEPNAADHLALIPAGATGIVTCVESHGMNPWTRYTVHFDDGSRAHGMVAGSDFEFIDQGAIR